MKKKPSEIKYESSLPTFSPTTFLRRSFIMSVDSSFENTIHWKFENTADYVKDSRFAFMDKELNRFIALRTYSGEGILHLSDKKFVLTENSLIFFVHHQPRKHYTSGDHWDFDWFEFYISEPIFPLEEIIIKHPTKYEITCRSHVFRLHSSEPNRLPVQGAFAFLLSIWSTYLSVKTAPYSYEIGVITSYINNNLDRKLKIEDLAKMCNFSPRYFRMIFFQNLGISPQNYIENKRMEKCSQLLISTKKTLSEICEIVGISSPYYLSVRFKKHFNVSPLKFRASYEQNKKNDKS